MKAREARSSSPAAETRSDSRSAIRKPRVALVLPSLRFGGVEVFLLRLARQLRQLGCDVEVVTSQAAGDWKEAFVREGLAVRHVRWPWPYPGWWQARRVGKALASWRYDMVILNHAPYAQAGLGRLPDGVGAVAVIHNDIESEYRIACGNCMALNAIVAPTPCLRDEAQRRAIGHRVVLLPHGVVVEESLASPVGVKRQAPFRLAFVGRLEQRQKQILLLPKILHALEQRRIEVVLDVVGSGPDEPRLREAMAVPGLSARTRFHGLLSPDDVYRLLHDCHVLLLPSAFEAFGLVLLEAQACFCVPVCSRLPGITDFVVQDGVTGLLADVGNAEQFASAVATLADDRERWARMAEAGRERTHGEFSIEVMGRAYRRLIENVLAGEYSLPRSRKDGPLVDMKPLLWRDLIPAGIWRALRFLRACLRRGEWLRGSRDHAR